ncbi:MAG: hypothetical protein KC587_15990, partial [Nitrospira sp.]|nr:hypothetical protein [Nitrospira sp.]
EKIESTEFCQFIPGLGSARGTGLVNVEAEDKFFYSVISESGATDLEPLEFKPNKAQIVGRNDGSILKAFGDLRWNEKVSRDRSAKTPLRIFHDQHLIYSHDDVINFRIASDGTSFFAVEKIGENASRLVARDIDAGTEVHYDLGGKHTSTTYVSKYWAKYTNAQDAILLEPTYENLTGSYELYGIAEKVIKAVPIEKYDGFLRFPDFDHLIVGKMNSEFTEVNVSLYEGERKKWETNIVDPHWSPDMGLELSDDNAWLAVQGWDLSILNLADGKVVFNLPLVRPKERIRERLKSVSPGPAVGSVRHVEIINGKLNIFRKFRCGENENCALGSEQAIDQYDLATIAIDSQPDSRIRLPKVKSCATYRGKIQYDAEGRAYFISYE